ncbi:MAG: hypothetical protein GX077_08895 [Tissierellia bacterium]|nr:hypothetical protein [Tissierellia bacterium]
MVDPNRPEEFLGEILDYENSKIYNFMINASNQANLSRNKNISPMQLNSIFVVISPYYIEKLNIEGMDINIDIDEEGIVTINNKNFEMIEIEPGVKVFGISKESKGC